MTYCNFSGRFSEDRQKLHILGGLHIILTANLTMWSILGMGHLEEPERALCMTYRMVWGRYDEQSWEKYWIHLSSIAEKENVLDIAF